MSAIHVRRLRLGAALVLLTYLILHFSNHALGIISLDAMAAGRWWFLALWRSVPGTLALYGAIAVHGGLALWLLYQRRTLRMPTWEATQYALGLMLPALLVAHVVGTRIAWWRLGADDPYSRIVLALWVLAPEYGARQALTLVLAWLHACIGVHFWLRFRPWYPRVRPWLFAVALLLPTLALLGFVAAGREVIALARTPGWSEAMLRAAHAPTTPEAVRLLAIREGFLTAYLLALLAVLLARGVRRLLEWRRAVQITYPSGRVVAVPVGFTILDASRTAGIPHASVCGGRGRCSTCRVRISRGLAQLPPASEAERRVLARVGAAPDVRLACQTRPVRDVAVEPLLAPSVAPADAFATDVRQGHEQELAVLFADLRGFTRMAEHKLPYDVVFFLNRYFEAVGHRDHGRGRRDEPVHRRRRDGAVRYRIGPGGGLAPGAGGGARHGGERGRAERRAGRRPAGADAHRHRHSRRARGGRSDGLGRELLSHGRGRHGPRRRAAGTGDQGLPRRAGPVRRGRPLRRGRPVSLPSARPGGAQPRGAGGRPCRHAGRPPSSDS